MKYKDDYIKMRNTGKYNINWFYKYFLENGGKNVGINTFQQVFGMYNQNETLNFLDNKFSLSILEDSEGKLIKIVE